jgi:hypothetical protein
MRVRVLGAAVALAPWVALVMVVVDTAKRWY